MEGWSKAPALTVKFTLCALLLCLGLGCAHRQKEATGIIGGADGPAAIYVAEDSAFLASQGLRLTQQMRKLANDSGYVANAAHAGKIKALVADIGKQEYDHPQKIFCITHLHMNMAKTLLSQSGATKPLILDRIVRSIPTLLNAQSGADHLAATSLLFAEDAFLYHGLKEYTLYLYLYDSNYQSMVLYRPGKQHIVLANASIVAHDRLKGLTTPADVKQFFADVLDMPEVEVQEKLSAE